MQSLDSELWRSPERKNGFRQRGQANPSSAVPAITAMARNTAPSAIKLRQRQAPSANAAMTTNHNPAACGFVVEHRRADDRLIEAAVANGGGIGRPNRVAVGVELVNLPTAAGRKSLAGLPRTL